jgi:hypothetical protein
MTPEASAGNRFELFSPFAPSECATRLASAVDGPLWIDLPGQPMGVRPMVGRVTEKRFSVSMRPRRDLVAQHLRRNSFKPHLRGTIEAVPGGSRLAGRTGLHPFVMAFLLFWFSGVVVIGSLMMFVALKQIHFNPRELYRLQWIFVVSPVAMLAFGSMLLHWGRALAEGEADELVSLLKLILDARPTRA